MAYFVLALGVLMSIAGLDAIATGYPIIQIERGWATVISGSAMLTGGLVTVALGLVVRALAGIKTALQSRPGLASASMPFMAPEPVSVPEPVMPEPRVAESALDRREIESMPAAAFVAAPVLVAPVLVAPVLAAPAVLAALVADHPEPAPEPAPEPFVPEEPEVTGLPHMEAHELGIAAQEADLAAEPATVHPEDAYELQSPSTREHDLAPRAVDPPPAEDWLDQAFSAFDHDISDGKPRGDHTAATGIEPADSVDRAPLVENAHAEPVVGIEGAEPVGEPDAPHAEHEHAALEHAAHGHTDHGYADHGHGDHDHAEHDHVDHDHAPPTAAAADALAPNPPDSAVIGRYELDGRTYVMYVDGSIEAQSDAGVYRFGSLAELKTFIEG